MACWGRLTVNTKHAAAAVLCRKFRRSKLRPVSMDEEKTSSSSAEVAGRCARVRCVTACFFTAMAGRSRNAKVLSRALQQRSKKKREWRWFIIGQKLSTSVLFAMMERFFLFTIDSYGAVCCQARRRFLLDTPPLTTATTATVRMLLVLDKLTSLFVSFSLVVRFLVWILVQLRLTFAQSMFHKSFGTRRRWLLSGRFERDHSMCGFFFKRSFQVRDNLFWHKLHKHHKLNVRQFWWLRQHSGDECVWIWPFDWLHWSMTILASNHLKDDWKI